MTTLYRRRILLIISGGIAAYKSLDLIRRLKDAGAQVRCILTEGGAQFITPLAVSALSGEPVFTHMFSADEEQRFGHIKLSRESDLIVVAPASANMIAKMAHGLADNLASTVLLASDKPVLIAPAMNSAMWSHKATQANIALLAERGIKQIGPARGSLACGEEGAGRMSEPADILDAIESHFAVPGPLAGKRALVTSGPTHEPIDPVRFIGNRSSGKQGHALAAALADQGASVTLVTGPTALPDPPHIQTMHVTTAHDMLEACQKSGPYDIAVCAAAVSDWRPTAPCTTKIKKGSAVPTLELMENPDILATLAQAGPTRPRLLIGFAAETENLAANATAKFERKGCDWLVANEVGNGKGFEADTNEVTLLRRDTKGDLVASPWSRMDKQEIARQLVQEITAFFTQGQKS